MMSSRTLYITLGSLCLTISVFLNAFAQYEQFYPSMVYITKSSPSMAILYIQAGVAVMLFTKCMVWTFFGVLRAAEIEHLIEKLWYTVTETCLSFTVFRDDFSPKFVGLFTVLLVLKCFHWLAEDRVDYMERSPIISRLFHLRAIGLISLLAIGDLAFIAYAYESFFKSTSVQLVFGFEYSILLVMLLQIKVKYILHAIDSREENSWENKNLLLLYMELVLGFVKITLYLVFLAIMINVHTFPLFAVRPLYQIIRNFRKAYNDVVMSRRAIYNMNHLYPDCTEEELAGADVCIICREDMTSVSKKLPCGHMFHKACLRSWFQRQQTCPTCRMDIMSPTATRPPVVPGGAAPAAPAAIAGAPAAIAATSAATTTAGPVPPLYSTPPTSGSTTTPTSSGAAIRPGVLPPMSVLRAHFPPGMPFPPPPMPPSGFNPMGLPHPGTSPFPQMPNIPMPQMPAREADLSGLDEATLRQMERNTSEGLRVRIRVMNDIHTLLDAAMSQMRQYVEISARIDAQHATAIPTTTSTTSSSNSSSQAPSTSGTTTTTTASSSSSPAGPSTSVAGTSGSSAGTTPSTSTGQSSKVPSTGGSGKRVVHNHSHIGNKVSSSHTETTDKKVVNNNSNQVLPSSKKPKVEEKMDATKIALQIVENSESASTDDAKTNNKQEKNESLRQRRLEKFQS